MPHSRRPRSRGASPGAVFQQRSRQGAADALQQGRALTSYEEVGSTQLRYSPPSSSLPEYQNPERSTASRLVEGEESKDDSLFNPIQNRLSTRKTTRNATANSTFASQTAYRCPSAAHVLRQSATSAPRGPPPEAIDVPQTNQPLTSPRGPPVLHVAQPIPNSTARWPSSTIGTDLTSKMGTYWEKQQILQWSDEVESVQSSHEQNAKHSSLSASLIANSLSTSSPHVFQPQRSPSPVHSN